MENKVLEIVNKKSDSVLLLTCEHAGVDVPVEYNNLGLDEKQLDTHIARDKGCKELTKKLAQRLNCCAVLGRYSRLLINLNRRENEEELIVKVSDKVVIKGNENLDKTEIKKRLDKYYFPYYKTVENQLEYIKLLGKKPVVFSIHSYTPQLKGGEYRPWQAGVLFHKPTKLAEFLYDELQKTDKNVGKNVPYDLRKYNTGTAVICGEEKGFDYALIEIRDDEFDNIEQGAEEWAKILGDILNKYLSI